MNRRQAEAEIHRIVISDSGRVYLTKHARERNPSIGKRPLTRMEIVTVLESGSITEGPSEDIKLGGGWKFTMLKSYDRHTYRVAGVLIPQSRILVITGFEDFSHFPRPVRGIGADTE